MSSEIPPKPLWIKKALQGIAFWMGHRQSLYARYSLTEAAIVAELSNLVYANLGKDFRLRSEVPFGTFMKTTRPESITARERVDLVVAERVPKGEVLALKVMYIIEIKRGQALNSKIDEDLRRLVEVKRRRPESRTLLFVISEGSRPPRFVSEEGERLSGKYDVPGCDGYFLVRNVYRAASAGPNSAHYACHIEVFARCHGHSNVR